MRTEFEEKDIEARFRNDVGRSKNGQRRNKYY